MAKRRTSGATQAPPADPAASAVPGNLPAAKTGRPSALLDTRVIYCGDNLEQFRNLPPACVDLIYIDPPFRGFNSNRNYEVFWGETKEKRSFEDRHASIFRGQAYIDYMRPRCVELSRVLKKTAASTTTATGISNPLWIRQHDIRGSDESVHQVNRYHGTAIVSKLSHNRELA